MKNRRKINGVKNTNENYKGNASVIVKKIVALLLSVGMIITAAEAIELYNRWRASKTKDTETAEKQNIREVSLEDVKQIVEEYREAKNNNDTEKIKEINMKLSEGNYIDALNKGLKEQVVKSLGLDPEKVDVLQARDGVFLIDKEKAKKGAVVDHTGQINNSVKYVDENGKNPKIPHEMKQILLRVGNATPTGKYMRIDELDVYYADLEEVAEYSADIEVGDEERE